MRTRARRDSGSATVELAVLMPVIVLIGLLIVAAGRLHSAQQAVDHAAAVAAREASLTRTPAAAAASARATASGVLTQRGLACSPAINVDTSDFPSRPGTLGLTRVRVSCTVRLADLAIPGLPGAKTVSASLTSPIDPFRGTTK